MVLNKVEIYFKRSASLLGGTSATSEISFTNGSLMNLNTDSIERMEYMLQGWKIDGENQFIRLLPRMDCLHVSVRQIGQLPPMTILIAEFALSDISLVNLSASFLVEPAGYY
jgi:hypothetical protein